MTTITILVENTAPTPNFKGEYGLALLIQKSGHTILFDTGSADALFYNAQAANKDLSQVDKLIISHGHFDHTGALKPFLQKFPAVELYAHSEIFAEHSKKNLDGSLTYIGSPVSLTEIKNMGINVKFTNDFTEIAPDIFVTGSVPRKTDFEDVGGPFFLPGQADKIVDDQAIILQEEDGIIIISGCAHAGIINTIEYALQKTGAHHIKAVIGGTHLMNAGDDRIEKTIAAFKNYSLDRILLSHCTGFKAAAKMHAVFGDKVEKAESGAQFVF